MTTKPHHGDAVCQEKLIWIIQESEKMTFMVIKKTDDKKINGDLLHVFFKSFFKTCSVTKFPCMICIL